MQGADDEEKLLHSVALQNAQSILLARQRAEQELERKTEELAQSLAMMRATLESTTDAILVTNELGVVTDFNQKYIEMWGVPRAVMDLRHHQNLLEFCSGFFQDAARYQAEISDVYSTSLPDSYHLLELNDGRIIERFSQLQRIEQRNVGRVWSFRDITERKRAEEELRQQRERFQVTLSSIGDAVITTDMQGRVTFLNPVAETMTGWSSSEASGRPLDDVFCIVNEHTRQPAENPVFRVLQEGLVVGLANHTVLISKDGIETAIEDSAAPIRDASGQIAGAVMVFHDVSERRRNEERLRSSENLKSAILDAAIDAIINMDHNGRIADFNPAAERMFGFAAADAVGRPLAELIIPDRFRQRHLAGLARYLATGESAILGKRIELAALDARGREFPVELTVCRIGGVEPPMFTATLRDITERKVAEEALRKSEQFNRTIIESSRDCIKTLSLTGDLLWINEMGRTAIGDIGELVGQSWIGFWPEEDRAAASHAVRMAADGGIANFAGRFEVAGQLRWWDVIISPILDAVGKPERLLAVSRDVTASKQSELTTRFLANASAELAELTDYESTLHRVASLSVPFFADWCAIDILEADGTVRRLAITHSDAAKVQLSIELDRRFPPNPASPHGALKVLQTGKPEWAPTISDEQLARFATDEQSLQMIRELGLKSYLCVPLISRNKTFGSITFAMAESGRVFNTGDLHAAEDLAHRAAIAVENANLVTVLRESDRRKDEFLAMLAHELRNPLAPIRNATNILHLKSSVIPELKLAREVIERQVAQMTRLVDDLLDVSRITRGKIELRKQRIELAATVNIAIETCRPLIEKYDHQLAVQIPSEPLFLMADQARLTQVLSNLLNNAAKYMDPGGRIWLDASRDGDQVVVRVRDNGIGIAKEMLPRVFDMFTQVDHSLERSQGGLGIGLTLVQRLVTLHGGTVDAFSNGAGTGSEFVVRLPLIVEPLEQAPQSEHPDSPPLEMPARRRILVVDDNRDSANTLTTLLRLQGNEVQTAHDGLAAVEAARTFRPDVVLLDIGLPRMNGYEAAVHIRKDLGSAVVLIALTGWGQPDDRRRSREAGFDHHLTKPIDFETLNRLLK